MPNGIAISAAFSFKKIERVQLREEACYYFVLSADQTEVASRLVGMDVPGELWLSLDRPARVVPKLALVMQLPTAFQKRNWAEAAAQVWPGARVVAEGQSEIAIELAEDGKHGHAGVQ